MERCQAWLLSVIVNGGGGGGAACLWGCMEQTTLAESTSNGALEWPANEGEVKGPLKVYAHC